MTKRTAGPNVLGPAVRVLTFENGTAGNGGSEVKTLEKKWSGWTLVPEMVRCGRDKCRACGKSGYGHGPYWYGYCTVDGRKIKRYFGRTHPSTLEGVSYEPGGDLANADHWAPYKGEYADVPNAKTTKGGGRRGADPGAADKFDAIWTQLVENGRADDKGGAQYRRVRGLWEKQGKPSPRRFILDNLMDNPVDPKGKGKNSASSKHNKEDRKPESWEPILKAGCRNTGLARTILSLPPMFSKKELKLAHKNKSMEHHPDRGGSVYRQSCINAALEVLQKSLSK